MQRYILALFSDIHSGFVLGLMNPETILEAEDGDTVYKYHPQLSATQEHLWSRYEEDIDSVARFANGDPIVAVHNGDIAHGIKYIQQLVSTRMADQIVIGYYNMLPWLEMNNVISLRLIYGTSAHNFGEGSADILVARWLASEFPNRDIQSYHHGLMNIGGVLVDFSHHGPYHGSRQWLTGNVANFYLRDLMTREIMRGKKPPDLVVRSHYHTYVKVTLNISIDDTDFESILVITPSYSGAGDFARQHARSPYLITNGMVAVEIIDGEIGRVKRYSKTLDIRVKETIDER